MNTQQRATIDLIKSALKNEKILLSKDIDLDAVYDIAKSHGIAAIIYNGAYICGVNNQNEIMKKLFVLTCEYISYSQRQICMIDRILSEFEKQKIEYLPLKGIVLKNLYPKPEMRIMGDADILVRLSQYENAKKIMSELGFKEQEVTDHEMHWMHPSLHVELHSKLIPSYNKDYYNYFGDGWKLAKKVCDSSRFEMTNENEFIYLFTHFAKHYRDAGIGIKHILDIYVYLNSNPNLNEKYIIAELKKLQLNTFYVNIIDTLDVWFNNKEENEVTELITKTIFNSGAKGSYESALLSAALKIKKSGNNKKSVRLKKMLGAVFKPYKIMTNRYKILRKCPFLLPFCWFANIFDLFKGKKLSKGLNQFKIMSEENINTYQQSLNFVGLDFNFKE